MIKHRFVVGLVGCFMLLSACQGSQTGQQPGSGDQPAEEEQSPPEEEMGPVATCEDPSGDADASVSAFPSGEEPENYTGDIPGHADLTRVDLSMSEGAARIDVELAAELPSTGQDALLPRTGVSLRVIVDNWSVYSLNVTEDGEATGHEFAQGGGEATELDLADARVTTEGNLISLEIPLESVPRMEGEFHWWANVSAREDKPFEEKQIRAGDSCPDLTADEEGKLAATYNKVPAGIVDKLPTQP